MGRLRRKGKRSAKKRAKAAAARKLELSAKAEAILVLSPDEREAALDALYLKYDTNGDGTISVKELKECLGGWGVDLSSENVDMLMDAYDNDENPGLEQADMKDIMKFYLLLKAKFRECDADGSDSVSRRELGQLFPAVGFDLDPETQQLLITIFDDDNSGDMDFEEFATVMFYLRNLQHQAEVAGSEIDPSEFHALLRSFAVRLTPREAKAAFDLLESQGFNFNEINFAKIVAVVSATKDNLPQILAAAHEAKKAERARMKEEGVDRGKRLRAATLFTADKIAAIDEMKDNKRARRIIRRLKRSPGSLFEDDKFPCTPESLFPENPSRAEGIEWLRPTELNGVTNPALCIDGIDEGDVCQGSLGDCWFLSALSTVAQSGNEQIQCLFVNFFPEYGFVQCRFYKDGDWKLITVDDRIPAKNGRIVFASCRDPNELWVPLIEKAYAKLHGSFENIESGIINNALVDLTGEPSESDDIVNTDEDWEELKRNIAEGFYMGCAASAAESGIEEDNGLGILYNHAYGVLDAVDIRGKRLVKCRNPWGKYEWKGRWSDGSKEWTPQFIQELGVTFGDDGTFWMAFEDFAAVYNRLYTLRIYIDDIGEKWERTFFSDGWIGIRAGGCANYPTFSNNPQYLISCDKECPLFVSLLQPCHRYRRARTVKYEPIAVSIFKKTKDDTFRQESLVDPVDTSGFPTNRENAMDFTMEANTKYLLVPHTFHPDVETEYYLTIFSRYLIQCDELLDSADFPTIESEWTAETAGGCTNHPTWVNNPQYSIKFREDCLCEIILTQHADRKSLTHIGFYVWATGSNKRNKNKKAPVAVTSAISNSTSVTASFEAQQGKYTIMPCTFEAGITIPFTLKICGNAKVKPVQEATVEIYKSAWGEGTDGGCRNHDSWQNNPTFPLTIDEATSVEIDLKVTEKNPIGYYIMDVSLENLVHSGKFAKTRAITERVDLGEGDYLILPATFNPGIRCEFDLEVGFQDVSFDSSDEGDV